METSCSEPKVRGFSLVVSCPLPYAVQALGFRVPGREQCFFFTQLLLSSMSVWGRGGGSSGLMGGISRIVEGSGFSFRVWSGRCSVHAKTEGNPKEGLTVDGAHLAPLKSPMAP